MWRQKGESKGKRVVFYPIHSLNVWGLTAPPVGTYGVPPAHLVRDGTGAHCCAKPSGENVNKRNGTSRWFLPSGAKATGKFDVMYFQ